MSIEDWSRPTAQFLGRFQPWDPGHRAILDSMIYKGRIETPAMYRTSKAQQVVIMVRAPHKKDPYTFEQIKKTIEDDLKVDYPKMIEIIQVPNITNVFYGRTIGYDVERIHIDKDLEPLETKTTIAEKQHFNRDFWAGRQ